MRASFANVLIEKYLAKSLALVPGLKRVSNGKGTPLKQPFKCNAHAWQDNTLDPGILRVDMQPASWARI